MATGNYNAILDRCVLAVRGLTMTDLDATACQKRKLPTAEESIDNPPLIIVCPGLDPVRVERLSFEPDAAVTRVYAVDVVWIEGGNRDLVSNLGRNARWSEQLWRLFEPHSLDGVPSVYLTEVEPFTLFDRPLISRNYEYGGVTVRFHSAEPRTD